MKKTIYIVGIGPGGMDGMTIEAERVLAGADVIVGYETYLDLVRDKYPDAEYLSTPMRKERERCIMAFEAAGSGKSVVMICSGDAGVYGMASLMYEELGKRDCEEYELKVVAGVSAALSGAALLGAPIGHDFCVISLSDLLTPWEVIVRRLKAAAEGDFVIVLYNPSSHKRADYLKKVTDILGEYLEPDRICGIARLIGREGQDKWLCRLDELSEVGADMFSTVFIGSSTTRIIDGHMVTPRGYK
ncbi:MAG: precorrin-3B C(17)-methyltransferase [Lachnospiraceae bacterium]|nr:precorrin-3B C(17)-methyltransferase [Lachnospiraceae bacterium]